MGALSFCCLFHMWHTCTPTLQMKSDELVPCSFMFSSLCAKSTAPLTQRERERENIASEESVIKALFN